MANGINSGNCVLFVDTLNLAFDIEVKGFKQRSVDKPNNEIVYFQWLIYSLFNNWPSFIKWIVFTHLSNKKNSPFGERRIGRELLDRDVVLGLDDAEAVVEPAVDDGDFLVVAVKIHEEGMPEGFHPGDGFVERHRLKVD